MDLTHWHEQVVHARRLGDYALLLEIAYQRLQRRSIGLDAIGPRIAAERPVDLIELGVHPWQHVAQRGAVIHPGERDVLGLTESAVQRGREERMLFVHVA